MHVVTRFAPSPTGGLHIGSVRTVLFNWLYARAKGGKFLLRIEDTDRERNKSEHVDDICQTLKWLGLNWDGDIVFQHKNIARHQEVAHKLLADGKAYKCYCTPEELDAARQLAMREGRTPRYERKCRDLVQELNKPFAVRLKAPLQGKTEFTDLIQGHCCVDNEHMDDMVLLRSDGTPTYMLAVVVDDHDMEITNVIRASEHLGNTYRQKQIYQACGWHVPEFAHVSLIHGEDGAKLSKRHGAPTLAEYKEQGFLKEAILNYLLRLGWSKGEEIISMDECIKIFDIRDVHCSAARFSLPKLLNINSIYLRAKSDQELVIALKEFIGQDVYTEAGWARVELGMSELKARNRTLVELAKMSAIYGNAGEYFGVVEKSAFMENLVTVIKDRPWSESEDTAVWLNEIISQNNTTLKEVAPHIRMALTKEKVAPSIFELMKVLGSKICAERFMRAIGFHVGK